MIPLARMLYVHSVRLVDFCTTAIIPISRSRLPTASAALPTGAIYILSEYFVFNSVRPPEQPSDCRSDEVNWNSLSIFS
jgi:hypothetical protein